MSKHMRLAASASNRWLVCTGSIRLIEALRATKKIPESTTNPASELGTAVHHIIEQVLLGKSNLSSFFGQKIKVDGMTQPVLITKKEIAGARICIRFAKRRKRKLNAKLFPERSYDLTNIYKSPLGGTADITLLEPKVLHIVDYKNGVGHVEADGNTQLRIYALGAWYCFSEKHDIEKIILTIIQPNSRKLSEPKIRSEEFSIDELIRWERKILLPTLSKIQTNRDELIPDEENQCYWCEAKAHCTARLEKKTKLRYDVTRKLDLVPITSSGALPEPETLTENELSNVLKNADQVIKFYNDCKKLALRQLEKDSSAITGWGKVPKLGNRRFKDEKELKRKLRKKKVTVKQITLHEDRLMSVTELEKYLLDNLKWSKDIVAEFMEDVTIRPKSGFILQQVESGEDDFSEFAKPETKKPRKRKS